MYQYREDYSDISSEPHLPILSRLIRKIFIFQASVFCTHAYFPLKMCTCENISYLKVVSSEKFDLVINRNKMSLSTT